MLLLSVRIQVEEWPHLDAVGGASGPCETLRVSVSPGVVATNLLHCPLFVAPASAATAAHPCLLDPGATQPILTTWQGGSQEWGLLVAMRADLMASALSAASAAASRGDSSARGCGNSGAPKTAGFVESLVEFLEGAAGSSPAAAHDLTAPATCSDPFGSIKGVGLLPVLSAQGRRSRLLLIDEDEQVMALESSCQATRLWLLRR